MFTPYVGALGDAALAESSLQISGKRTTVLCGSIHHHLNSVRYAKQRTAYTLRLTLTRTPRCAVTTAV